MNSLFPLSAELSILSDGNVRVISHLFDEDLTKLIEALKNGYKSEVLIQIQLFKERELPYSLFGDELIKKIEVQKTSEIDLFSDDFIIKDKSLVSYFQNQDEFISQYFQNEISLPFELSEKEFSDNYYIKLKATLVIRIIHQPFNILYHISSRYRSTTGWIKVNFNQVLQ